MDTETNITRTRYKAVNATWPDVLPIPTPQEAVSAAKRLYRFAMGRAFKGDIQITSGNRGTWIRRGILHVNPNATGRGDHGGWHSLVHDLSHLCFQRLHPNRQPHDWRHAKLEASMISHVVGSGWLDGKLKRPEKPKANPADLRYRRIVDAITRWESKERRAKNALKKLQRQKAYYERKAATVQ